jgi:hypothetical protein
MSHLFFSQSPLKIQAKKRNPHSEEPKKEPYKKEGCYGIELELELELELEPERDKIVGNIYA